MPKQNMTKPTKERICKHQYFELGKLLKNTKLESEINKKFVENYFLRIENLSAGELPAVGPITLKPSINGVRVKCALCGNQKDIYENTNSQSRTRGKGR